MIAEAAAVASCVWYVVVVVVCGIGYVQLQRQYSGLARDAPPRSNSSSSTSDDDEDDEDDSTLPHVTVIRPVKGLEPFLYECLASTFQQTYPRHRLTTYLCVATRRDPAVAVLERLLRDFAACEARIFVEEEDDDGEGVGPNPKIRNVRRAYREARGELVWHVDCNVWVGPGVAGRMVSTLCGFGPGGRKNKLVHQLPLVVDTTTAAGSSSSPAHPHGSGGGGGSLGGAMEEVFMSSSHAKFYTAINTVLLAPCVVGKSNMFRKPHLDALTAGAGLDRFAHNICEDHLIGDVLWKAPVPAAVLAAAERTERARRRRHSSEGEEEAEKDKDETWGNHALLPSSPAIQPMANIALGEYVARRVRWLRVRKFTVPLATLVEPGTECFVCSLHGAFAFTTLPFFRRALGAAPTWAAFAGFWVVSVALWVWVDWTLYLRLHARRTCVDGVDCHTPHFARNADGVGRRRRGFGGWFAAWLGREALALPIWVWAVWGGATVVWRGQRFRVGMDMRVRRVGGGKTEETAARRADGAFGFKARAD